MELNNEEHFTTKATGENPISIGGNNMAPSADQVFSIESLHFKESSWVV